MRVRIKKGGGIIKKEEYLSKQEQIATIREFV